MIKASVRAWDTSSAVARGVATFLPGLQSAVRIINRRTTAEIGGTFSAEYCYSAWMRHLVLAHNSGILNSFRSVAELGPGNSVGTGLCALFSGAEHYFGLDAVRHIREANAARLFDEIVELFRRRAPIPDSPFGGYRLRPRLNEYGFPHHVLDEEGGYLPRCRKHA